MNRNGIIFLTFALLCVNTLAGKIVKTESAANFSANKIYAKNTYVQSKDFFEYDRSKPLDVRETLVREHNGAKVIELNYASPKSGRVPAFLILPKKGKAVGAVLYQHGLGENVNTKNTFLDEAAEMAKKHKIAALLIDAPFARPDPDRIPFGSMRDRDLLIQNIVDWRRGIDLLENRTEIDSKNLAFVGHSYGGRIGGMMSGTDRRIKYFILMAAIADSVEWMRSTNDPNIIALRKGTPKQDLDYYLSSIEPLESKNFLGSAAPAELFFQFAEREEYTTRKQMDDTFAVASQPKQVKYYDATHNLNQQAKTDRIKWLVKRLKK